MPAEHRTRITLLLPEPTNLSQFFLVDKVITGLVQMCGGATASSYIPAIFDGIWMDGTTNQTVKDANMLIVADAPGSPMNLVAYLDKVKQQCQIDFQQDIIWITTHTIERITTDDYVK
jgi:hypothetical protein